jgi:hypothetical protein
MKKTQRALGQTVSDTQYRGGRPKSQQKFQAQPSQYLLLSSSSFYHLKKSTMADHHEEDELAPTQTAGYKVGEKKTMEEYQNLDANDESLKKWKQSLGLGGASGKYSKPCSVCSSKHWFLLC